MIILKNPIELTSCRPFVMESQSFPQRLMGNYALGGTSFTPKELFLLVGAEPQQQEETGGMTTIVSTTSMSSSNSLKLEVINNLINRIMLLDTNNFTYQDEVYVTAVLHKLGITEVQQFVNEARELLRESSAITSLLSYYKENAELLRSQVVTATELPIKRGEHVAKREEQAAPAKPTYYMQEEIYNRLHTAQIYSTMNSLSQSTIMISERSLHQSLLLAEQQRVSNLMLLNEQRGSVIHELMPLTLLKQGNDYERGENLPVPRTEAAIYSHAMAGAMLSTVQHLTVQRFASQLRSGDMWLDVSSSLSQTVDNSLRRYELYHGGSDKYRTENINEQQMLLQEAKLFADYRYSSETQKNELYSRTQQMILAQQEEAELSPEAAQLLSQVNILQEQTAQHNLLLQEQHNLSQYQESTSYRQIDGLELHQEQFMEQLQQVTQVGQPAEQTDFTEAALTLLQGEQSVDTVQPVQQFIQLNEQDSQHPTETQQADYTEIKLPLTGSDALPTNLDLQRSPEAPAPVVTELLLPTDSEQPADTVQPVQQLVQLNEQERKQLTELQQTEHPVIKLPSLGTDVSSTDFGLQRSPEAPEPVVTELLLPVDSEQSADTVQPVQQFVQLNEQERKRLAELQQTEHPEIKLLSTGLDVLLTDFGLQRSSEAPEPVVTELLLPTDSEQPADTVQPVQQFMQLSEQDRQRMTEARQAEYPDIKLPLTGSDGSLTIPGLQRSPEAPEPVVTELLLPTDSEQPADSVRLVQQPLQLDEQNRQRFTEARQVEYRVITLLSTGLGGAPASSNLLQSPEPPERVVTELLQAADSEQSVDSVQQVQQLRQAEEQNRKRLTELQQAGYPEIKLPSTVPEGRQDSKTLSQLPELTEQVAVELLKAAEGEPSVDSVQMIQQLQQLNEQNRKRMAEVQQQAAHAEVKRTATGSDMERTKRDSLRALENPEQVIAELRQAAAAEQSGRPKFAPEVELLLNSADETTRTLLETVMLREYGIEQKSDLVQGLRTGNLGMLNAEGMRQQQELQELVYSGQLGRELLQTETETQSERLQQIIHNTTATQATVATQEQAKTLLRLVHRAQTEQVSEEQLNEINKQQTVTEQKTTLKTESTDLHATEINEMTHQVVSHATEDISELVQRTIAKQMNTITSTVYRQMEKKLELERHRRGR